MTPEQAELEIRRLVAEMDAVRANTLMSNEDKDMRVSLLETQIQEMKQITGNRKITGIFRR